MCLYVRLHLQIMPRPLFATADSLLHTHTHTHTDTHTPKIMTLTDVCTYKYFL